MKNSTKKIALGTFIAAASGYLAGILTAPKSGKETRKQIKDNAIKARTEAEKKLKSMHSELDKLITQAKKNSSKLKSKAGKDFQKALAKATEAKTKARQMLSAIHEGDGEDKDLQKAIKDASSAVNHLKKFATRTANNVKRAAK